MAKTKKKTVKDGVLRKDIKELCERHTNENEKNEYDQGYADGQEDVVNDLRYLLGDEENEENEQW